MRRWTVMAASLAFVGVAHAYLAEFGIEGMGVVSTRADETRATVSPDGQRIVWSSDRPGGKGSADLWQAVLKDKRWQEPSPLPMNSPGNDFDPAFSADGRWLYFASDRRGGRGGTDLYRVAVRGDGRPGAVENLGPVINTAGDERSPSPTADGESLLFASDGRGGEGRQDLFAARRDGRAFSGVRALPGVNTGADETDGVLLAGGTAVAFARSADVETAPVRLWIGRCTGREFSGIAPVALSFNTDGNRTRGPAIDWSKPTEWLVAGSARAPRAGATDVYRMKIPAVSGSAGCS